MGFNEAGSGSGFLSDQDLGNADMKLYCNIYCRLELRVQPELERVERQLYRLHLPGQHQLQPVHTVHRRGKH